MASKAVISKIEGIIKNGESYGEILFCDGYYSLNWGCGEDGKCFDVWDNSKGQCFEHSVLKYAIKLLEKNILKRNLTLKDFD